MRHGFSSIARLLYKRYARVILLHSAMYALPQSE